MQRQDLTYSCPVCPSPHWLRGRPLCLCQPSPLDSQPAGTDASWNLLGEHACVLEPVVSLFISLHEWPLVVSSFSVSMNVFPFFLVTEWRFNWPSLLGDQALCSTLKSVTKGFCSSHDESPHVFRGKFSLFPGDSCEAST